MELNIKEIPFSRFGSYFCVSKENDTNEVYIRDVHGGDDAPSKLFKLDLLQDGVEQQFDIAATETSLRFYLVKDTEKYAEIIIPEEDELHIEVKWG